MVMGPTHAMSGAAGWLAASTAVGASFATFHPGSVPVLALGTMVTAGAALAPDIDSHSSTVVNSFGFLGRRGHDFANAMSVSVHSATRTRYDKRVEGGHRTLFHTGLFAIGAGLAVSGLASISANVEIMGKMFTWGQVFSLFIMFIFTHLAFAGLFESKVRNARRKYGPYVMMAGSAAFTLVAATLLPENETYGWLGLAVGLGWFIHLLGDAITKMGVPVLFPIKIRGKRWWDVTLPAFMRIRAGGTFEKVVLLPLLTVAVFVLAVNHFVPMGELFDSAVGLIAFVGS